MLEAKLHDGSSIEVEVHGTGPTVLLPVNPRPAEGAQADGMRKWGMDPALGRSLIEGLSDAFQVVAFDYEGHLMAMPRAETLTPATITADLLAVADAVGADRFAYYGYSWLALSGLQLALRTDRLSALVMGGFPPMDGPYAGMLKVTMATHEAAAAAASTPKAQQAPSDQMWGGQASDDQAWGDQAAGDFDWSTVEVTLTEPQTRQFATLYQSLQDFDDRTAQPQITCPRLCFVGSTDEISYGERWGDVHISLAGPIINHRTELEALGWDVHVLDGLDHTQAMQPTHVLPILRPWLLSQAGR
ncbi:Pimeloyl-ACP methyl ester carboxylesterase [Streptosporangium subroseum]|uniref:Pimeloyl-ACP methyl ester carboxylesterase n=2 Tax=Streptosporangium subroseum TaxID=106412 RepID=A0A239NVB1_9ACTN|nr:Pimeloyl-ACP methyl ester carboxylesterase [Streptosporangium subroseum]